MGNGWRDWSQAIVEPKLLPPCLPLYWVPKLPATSSHSSSSAPHRLSVPTVLCCACSISWVFILFLSLVWIVNLLWSAQFPLWKGLWNLASRGMGKINWNGPSEASEIRNSSFFFLIFIYCFGLRPHMAVFGSYIKQCSGTLPAVLMRPCGTWNRKHPVCKVWTLVCGVSSISLAPAQWLLICPSGPPYPPHPLEYFTSV